MKRIVLTLIILLATTAAFAGGKECQLKAGKNVELTGTLSADGDKAVFHVANSSQTYHVCEKTKASILKLANESNATLQVKGQVVSCEGHEELKIDTAKKL